MYRPLFLHILSKVEDYDLYFVQTRNCAGITRFVFPSKGDCAHLECSIMEYQMTMWMSICVLEKPSQSNL
jgi:hypothetical protein